LQRLTEKIKTHTQMKKFIAIFAIIATFGFVACNNAAETEATTEDTTAATEEAAATAEVEAAATTDSTAAAADTTKK
jgi:uncharacterized lipoprotein NlpE involved in copper resistance